MVDVDDINWPVVKTRLQKLVDNPRAPASRDEWVLAIDDVHPEAGGTFGAGSIVDEAAMQDILEQHGEEMNSRYSPGREFNDSSRTKVGAESQEFKIGDREYAPTMVATDQWIVYGDTKRVRAPWVTNSLCRVLWGNDLDYYPETSFREVKRWCETKVWETLPYADDIEAIQPGYILQRSLKEPENNIVMVDLDYVRDPDTGEIIDAAMDIIGRLDSYSEVSVSGSGVHIFLNGTLPDWFDGKQVVRELDTTEAPVGEQPQIEIYHRRRLAVTTGDRLPDTPDDVQYRHEVLDEVVDKFVDDDDRISVEKVADDALSYDCDDRSGSGAQSEYFDVHVDDVMAITNDFADSGQGLRGPHPLHGSKSGTNFLIRPDAGAWQCWRHDSSGGALHLVAIRAGYLLCDDSGEGSLSQLSPRELADVCLRIRDRCNAVSTNATPPYRALVGVGREMGLVDEGDTRIDPSIRDLVEELYDGLSPGFFLN